MKKTIVRNTKGAATAKPCACGLWLRHWTNAPPVDDLAPLCGNVCCANQATGGSHVDAQTHSPGATKWSPEEGGPFVVPLCDVCGAPANTEWMHLRNGCKLTFASARPWCRPPTSKRPALHSAGQQLNPL